MANSSLKQILNEARDSGALEIEGAKLDFAIALARLLEVSKMSRSELAKALQVSLPMVTKILRGDTNLTIETMVRAVRAAKGELQIHVAPTMSAKQRIDQVLASTAISHAGRISSARVVEAQDNLNHWESAANDHEIESAAA